MILLMFGLLLGLEFSVVGIMLIGMTNDPTSVFSGNSYVRNKGGQLVAAGYCLWAMTILLGVRV